MDDVDSWQRISCSAQIWILTDGAQALGKAKWHGLIVAAPAVASSESWEATSALVCAGSRRKRPGNEEMGVGVLSSVGARYRTRDGCQKKHTNDVER